MLTLTIICSGLLSFTYGYWAGVKSQRQTIQQLMENFKVTLKRWEKTTQEYRELTRKVKNLIDQSKP